MIMIILYYTGILLIIIKRGYMNDSVISSILYMLHSVLKSKVSTKVFKRLIVLY